MQLRIEAMEKAVDLVQPALDKFYGSLTDEQKARWVPRLVAGEDQCCFGFTEPDAGLNTTRIKTFAEKVPGVSYTDNVDALIQIGRQVLGVHPNTIYSRLDRIRELTGLDGQRYHDLVELLLAADCWQT